MNWPLKAYAHLLTLELGHELYCNPHVPPIMALTVILPLFLLYSLGCVSIWVTPS